MEGTEKSPHAQVSPRHGHCLCGSVKVEGTSAGHRVGACHCVMCRRWGGGPFMEIDCGTNVAFDGAEHIAVYDSSPWAERGFCRNCGTHLFYRLKGNGQTMVPVGLFDEDQGLILEQQVFIDSKPPYYSFVEQTEELTGAQIFAMYGPGQD